MNTAKAIVMSIFTAIYTSCWWSVCTFPANKDNPGWLIPLMLLIVMNAFLAIGTTFWIIDNWNKK